MRIAPEHTTKNFIGMGIGIRAGMNTVTNPYRLNQSRNRARWLAGASAFIRRSPPLREA